MTVVRRIARPMLAGIFVSAGANSLRDQSYGIPLAQKVGVPIAQRMPSLPQDPAQLVRLNAAVELGAGALLALNKFPRLAALALLASNVPVTLAAHAFWQEEDPGQRAMQQIQFLKNVSLWGGLLHVVVDTQGKPGLTWRAKHAASSTGHVVRATRREARLAGKAAKTSARAASARARTKLAA